MHDTWQTAMNVRYGSKRNGKKITPAKETTSTDKLLKISDALNNALCTNFYVSEDDLAKIIDSTGQDF